MASEVLQYHPRPLETPARKRPPLDFSIAGLVFCSLMMVMGLAAINSQVNLLFAVLGLMVGILLISGVIGREGLRRLSLTRALPDHGTVGRPISIAYEIHNNKRVAPSMSVTISELDGVEAFTKQPQAYMLHTPGGATSRIVVELLAKRRGLHRFSRYQLISSFPFGFIRRCVDGAQDDTLLIYPAIGRVDDSIIKMCRSAESAGTQMHPRPGGADEFYGVKEYREGENPRWIYWRRSARTGTLVAREMTHVAPPKLLLLVDTHLPDPVPQGRATVERMIAMAATLVSQAAEQGLPVGMMAWSDGWIHIPPRRGKRHRRDLLTALAQLPDNITHSTTTLLNESHHHRDSTTSAILITAGSPARSNGNDGLIVLSADSPLVVKGFEFPKTVDFNRCGPEEERQKEKGKSQKDKR